MHFHRYEKRERSLRVTNVGDRFVSGRLEDVVYVGRNVVVSALIEPAIARAAKL